jgi:hypothetical protein
MEYFQLEEHDVRIRIQGSHVTKLTTSEALLYEKNNFYFKMQKGMFFFLKPFEIAKIPGEDITR